MKIMQQFPPNYAAICSRFPAVRLMPGIIFAYGDRVYNPSGNELPDHVIVHESVHFEQQKESGPATWWARYLQDNEFRLSQEVEAYQAQYRYLCATSDRGHRRRILKKIIHDLSGAMYGKMLTKKEAEALIKAVI